jgi:hypothetical protein
MKKQILTLIVLSSVLTGFSQSAQLILSSSSLCSGDTLYATAVAPQYSISGSTGTNNQNGVMFDLISLESCVIHDFAINNLTALTTIEVYSKLGSHVGFESNSSAWTLVGTAANVQTGNDVELGLNLGIIMNTGQIRAFYITTTLGSHNINYTNGVAVGNLISSNSFLQLKTGVGKSYPFGSTFTPRDFIGRVIHSPQIVSAQWNTGATTPSIAFVPDRSMTLEATLTGSAATTFKTPAIAVIVHDVTLNATANPYTVSPSGSSTLTGKVTLKRGVATTMAGGNTQNGAMFDVAATMDISLTGFTVNIPQNSPADIEVLYKAGTHVGFEATAGAWTSLATYPQVPYGSGRYLALNAPLEVLAGQSVAFYITTTNQTLLSYSNGTQVGNISASAPGIQIKEGKGVEYPFGSVYSTRMLNTIVHYEVLNPSGTTYSWVHGGSGGSVVVTPGLTTTYKLNINSQGCSAEDTVTVVVSNIGIDEYVNTALLVYPNPASDVLNIEFPGADTGVQCLFTDITGKVVDDRQVFFSEGRANIHVDHLSQGIYFLKLLHGERRASVKVHIIR